MRLFSAPKAVWRRCSLTLLFALAAGCHAPAPAAPMPGPAPAARTLVQSLRAGGYTLVFRHAVADVCEDKLAPAAAPEAPGRPGPWRSCERDCATASARQLSDAGRQQARELGEWLRARGVPFGRVLASELCRAQETARLLALGPQVEETAALTYLVYGEAERCRGTTKLLNTPPAPGTNTALVTHSSEDCPPLHGLAPGEAGIYAPGPGEPRLVARVRAEAWRDLP